MNEVNLEFHNLSGYDAHLFIKQLATKINHGEINCIAENSEKYITFSFPMNVECMNKNGEIFKKKITIQFH